jgi:hypothetical protein
LPQTDELEEFTVRFDKNISILKIQLLELCQNKTEEQLNIKYDQLQVYVDNLAKSNVSVDKYELLQVTVDNLAANSVPANQIQELQTFVDVIAQQSVSVEKYVQLETVVNNIAASTVSRDYVDETLKQKITQQTSVIKELYTKIKDVELQKKEMQVMVDELAKTNDPKQRKTLKQQKIVIKNMQNEYELYKTKLNEHLNAVNKELRNDVVQIVTNMLVDLSASAKGK